MVPLRKIDCVLVKVSDLAAGASFYEEVFGLTRLWADETSVGMGMPETDAEVVLHIRDVPVEYAVNYLVDDVDSAVAAARLAGCKTLAEPFDVAVGRCAVLADAFGNAVSIIDLSKAPRNH
jgi:lactoylglutathione lyase